jgi:hypothetical protein
MTLAERVLGLHRSLVAQGLPHAFGGAIALAYWTFDPRGTSDIDVNVFVPAEDCAIALAALPDGVKQPSGTAEAIARDGQGRLWWGETPVDLFFDYVPIHTDAARNAQIVEFSDTSIPILGPVELTVFKVMFDRTRDWADIEAMAAAHTVDFAAVEAALHTLVEDDDPRFARLAEIGAGAG